MYSDRHAWTNTVDPDETLQNAVSPWVYTICHSSSNFLVVNFSCSNLRTTILSTALGKTFFAWPFILNENILFWLTISNQKPFVFSVSVFCSQIFTVKFNLRSKIGLIYAISIVKWLFGVFVLENNFLLFFTEFKLLMFHNNIVKISEKLNKQNLLKMCLQVTYPTDFCKIGIHFYYRKKWKYLLF